jgi:hypothetical protein
VHCCSDNNNPQEAHIDDHCVLSTSTTVSDVTAQTVQQFVCEYELTCWNGWTQYTDGGVEGSDSCFSVSASTAASWSAAASSCRPNSHLITSRSTSSSSGVLSSAKSSVSSLAGNNAYYGCSQASNATTVLSGWSWIDGTSSTNINCAVAGCAIWATAQPESVVECLRQLSVIWRLTLLTVSCVGAVTIMAEQKRTMRTLVAKQDQAMVSMTSVGPSSRSLCARRKSPPRCARPALRSTRIEARKAIIHVYLSQTLLRRTLRSQPCAQLVPTC